MKLLVSVCQCSAMSDKKRVCRGFLNSLITQISHHPRSTQRRLDSGTRLQLPARFQFQFRHSHLQTSHCITTREVTCDKYSSPSHDSSLRAQTMVYMLLVVSVICSLNSTGSDKVIFEAVFLSLSFTRHRNSSFFQF